MYCRVSHCKYSLTHVTQAHRCGICHCYGHGQIECGKPDKMSRLHRFYNDSLPEHMNCTVENCTYPWSHTTEAHHCSTCGIRGNCRCSIPNVSARETSIVMKQCPHCKVLSSVDTTLELFTGADCTICMEPKKMIMFSECKHANVCAECVIKLVDVP